MRQFLSSFYLLLAVSAQVAAESSHYNHAHDSTQLDAHLHGLAELTLAVDGTGVEISLESPAANIVGFEHKANTKPQREAVYQAKATLEAAEMLFAFTGTSCSLKSAEVDMSGVMADSDDHHGHERHKDHAEDHHDDHRGHEGGHHGHKEEHHGHEKKHRAGHHEESEDSHSEVTAAYHYACASGDELREFSVSLMERFPRIETLNVMWLTVAQQGAVTLKFGQKSVYLK